MHKRQQQKVDAYRRVGGFLGAHPGSFDEAKATLDEIVARLDALGTAHQEESRLRRNDTARQHERQRELRELHLRPIARIAKAALRGVEGVDVALRQPSTRLGTTQLLADARAVRNVAAQYKAEFVRHSMPEDFVEQLDAAITALAGTQSSRHGRSKSTAEAVSEFREQLRRGRQVIEILDAVVRRKFAGDPGALAGWEAAKRVRAVPGGRPPRQLELAVEDGGEEQAA